MPDSGKFKDLYLNSAHTYPCQGGTWGWGSLTRVLFGLGNDCYSKVRTMSSQDSDMTPAYSYGYAWTVRMSDNPEDLDSQFQNLLKIIPHDRIFTDECGTDFNARPGFQALLEVAKPGDQVHVVVTSEQLRGLDNSVVTLRFVTAWLGIKMDFVKPSSGRGRGAPRRLTRAKALQCKRLHDEGWSLRKIATKMKCSPGAVKSAMAWLNGPK